MENFRWERIVLMRAIFEQWRWGWYQNVKKSFHQSGVRGQGSGVRDQGSGVRGQNRGQISRFRVIFILFLDLTNLCTLFRPMTPDPRPLTLTPDCGMLFWGVRGQNSGHKSVISGKRVKMTPNPNIWPLFWDMTPNPWPWTPDPWLQDTHLSILVPVPSS